MRRPPAGGLRALGVGSLAAALSLAAPAALAQEPGPQASMQQMLRTLTERMEQLEQHNRELERRVEELTSRAATPPAAAAAPTAANAATAQPSAEAQPAGGPVASGRQTATESELARRVQALEVRTSTLQEQARKIEAFEGISVGASLTAFAQRVDANGSASGESQARTSYRGDVSITLPGGTWHDAEGAIFAHLRFGQGDGISLRPTFTSTPNSTAFQVTGVTDPDSSYAILAQAWYQLDVPLGQYAAGQSAARRLVLNAGKIDPFVFFDQNAIADDETRQFANNAFVHNPLLDSGGDVGGDAYGFAPGARIGYFDASNEDRAWGASLGVFGSGNAANFSGSPGHPFVIGQLEASPNLLDGLAGNYRLYAWRNGRANDFDGTEAVHVGWGLSADQQVHDATTLFARYGQRTSGHGAFDRALTVGVQVAGDYWHRAADAIGFALGFLRTSSEFRAATADGTLVGYAASGAERIAELYYHYHFNDRVEITPDLQWIQRAGGDPRAPTAMLVGVRARLGF